MKTPTFLLTILIAVIAVTAVGNELAIRSTASGVQFQELASGRGDAVGPGDVVTIHFIAWIETDGNKGNIIFNSYEQDNPVTFKLGTDKVIQGWNDVVTGMKPGEIRLSFIPHDLAYGDKSLGDMLPANTDLIYEIELIGVK